MPRRPPVAGKGEAEGGARAGARQQLQVAAVVEQDFLRDGEAEAHPLADLAGGGVGLEEARRGSRARCRGRRRPRRGRRRAPVSPARRVTVPTAASPRRRARGRARCCRRGSPAPAGACRGRAPPAGASPAARSGASRLGQAAAKVVTNSATTAPRSCTCGRGQREAGEGGELLGEAAEPLELLADAGAPPAGASLELLAAEQPFEARQLQAGGGERRAHLVGVPAGGLLPAGEVPEIGQALAVARHGPRGVLDHAGDPADQVAPSPTSPGSPTHGRRPGGQFAQRRLEAGEAGLLAALAHRQ